MPQLILHLLGDYVYGQSDWIAENKSKYWWPAILHTLLYSLPFLLIADCYAVLAIAITHCIIDRYRLARYVIWIKNFMCPWKLVAVDHQIESSPGYYVDDKPGEPSYISPYKIDGVTKNVLVSQNPPWESCNQTGYKNTMLSWHSVWLMILADNAIHLGINYLAIKWL